MFNVFRKKVFALFKYKLILQQLVVFFWFTLIHKKGAEILTLADTKWIGDKKMATCIVKTVFFEDSYSIFNFLTNKKCLQFYVKQIILFY